MYYITDMGNITNPVFYDPLPLYHSAGGIVGIGLMMVFGCTVVIRKKFSVRNFWKDCKKYNCNVSKSKLNSLLFDGYTRIDYIKVDHCYFWHIILIFQGAQYIGEICRYLLSAPETPEEKEHSLQIMFGNGKLILSCLTTISCKFPHQSNSFFRCYCRAKTKYMESIFSKVWN